MDETKKLLALSDDDWGGLDTELKDKLHLAISSLSEDLTDLRKIDSITESLCCHFEFSHSSIF